MPIRRSASGRFRAGVSEAIADIQWEPQPLAKDAIDLGNGDLVVIFQERGTYRYHDVNFSEYISFKDAPSWGEYFNENIRPNYLDYERIG